MYCIYPEPFFMTIVLTHLSTEGSITIHVGGPDDIRVISSFPAFSCLIPEYGRMFPLNDHRFSMNNPCFLARYQDLERRSARIYVHLEAPGKGKNPFHQWTPNTMSIHVMSQMVPKCPKCTSNFGYFNYILDILGVLEVALNFMKRLRPGFGSGGLAQDFGIPMGPLKWPTEMAYK